MLNKRLNRWQVIWQLLKNPKYWVYADGKTEVEFEKNMSKVNICFDVDYTIPYPNKKVTQYI